MGVVQKRSSGIKTRSRTRRVLSPLDTAKAYEIVWQQVAPVFECGARFSNATYVYFIGEENAGPVKIGHAKDPIARLRGMQTGNSRRLRIEHLLLGSRETEKLLHEMWREYAIFSASVKRPEDHPRTEWFAAEVRPVLFPIIATAASNQVDYLADGIPEGFGFDDTDRIVREAHIAHDFVVQGRDVPRLLASGAGYAHTLARPRI